MAVRKIPAVFKTSDGQEFDTEADAKRHQVAVDALKAFEDAKQNAAFAVAREQKTADGQPFDFGSSRQYWLVRDSWHGPHMLKIEFWGWYNQQFQMREDGQLEVAADMQGEQKAFFKVSSIYASENEARKELVQLLELRIAALTKDMETEKGKIV